MDSDGGNSFSFPNLFTLSATRRNLPHWQCESAIYWVTFRLADSVPQSQIKIWKEERDFWINRHPQPWSESDWEEYHELFETRMEAWLDAGCGSCVLKNRSIREIVGRCLLRFDGERLKIHSAVVMPNHVHVLIEPVGDNKLSQLMNGIKGASAREANKALNAAGQFWMHESYDHIVRNGKQYRHYLNYIAENPKKARLASDCYWFYQPAIAGCERQ